MTNIKAVRIHRYGAAEVLSLDDIPLPSPGPGEVLVRVRAMGVNPVDWKVRSGFVRALLPDSALPITPGADIAGVVEELGEGVTRFTVGDAVFGMVGLVGAYAEAVVVNAEHLALKPRSLDFMHSASVPLAALTAWQALLEAADLQPGQRVLVHAAAGGVGGFAVQFAHRRGANVTGTASAGNEAYVRALGADGFIDYRNTPVETMGSNYDVVLDMAGGETAAKSVRLLTPGGIVVVIAGRPAPQAPDAQGRRLTGIIVRPCGVTLAKLAASIDAGDVRTEIAAIFPLADVAKAHAMSEQGHTRGKIVLTA